METKNIINNTNSNIIKQLQPEQTKNILSIYMLMDIQQNQ